MSPLFVFFIVAITSSADKVVTENSSDVASETCDEYSKSCSSAEKLEAAEVVEDKDDENDKKTGIWSNFSIENYRFRTFKEMIKDYEEWHGLMLQEETIPCEDKQSLMFTPNAGLGDSIGALLGAFTYALQTGRLFFINWKPYPWHVGFQNLSFASSYTEASELKSKSGKKLLCVDPNDKSSAISGHVTAEHPIVKLAKENKRMNFDLSGLYDYLIRPSQKVEDIMNQVITKSYNNLADDVITHKVAIVIRTGEGEYNQFLSKGDEINFVKCFANYAKDLKSKMDNKKIEQRRLVFKVLVTSDYEKAKANTVEALDKLGEENKESFDIDVVTLSDSSVHVMHVDEQEQKLKKVRAKLRKTYAEFFLIGDADVRFLTHGSLFGRTASERKPEETNFFISDSHCDGKREKYSYLQCHQPKYPKLCGKL